MYQENIDHANDSLTQQDLFTGSYGTSLEELLEQAGTRLGGDLWDVDGVVFKVNTSDRIPSLDITGAWRDGLDCYHGLMCRRCGKEVERPATVPGHGYVLGPFHSECAREAEAQFDREVGKALEGAEASP